MSLLTVEFSIPLNMHYRGEKIELNKGKNHRGFQAFGIV